MRRYAEIYRNFVVGKHDRDDMSRPEFVGRIAIRIDQLTNQPKIGWHFDGRRFAAPAAGQPRNPNLDSPRPSSRELLEETRDAVARILAILEP